MSNRCQGECDCSRGRVAGLGPPPQALQAFVSVAPRLLAGLDGLAAEAASLAALQGKPGPAGRIGWVRAHLERWIRDLLTTPFGRDFLLARVELFRRHERMGIRLCDLLALTNAVRTSLEAAIRREGGDGEAAGLAVLAVHRLLDLDLLIWSHLRPEAPAAKAAGQVAGCRELGSSLGSGLLAGQATLAVVVDGEGRVVSLDPDAERALGWTTDELRGKPLPEAEGLEPVRGPGPCEAGAGDLGPARPILTRSGEQRLVRWTALPCGDENSHETLLVGRDVTEEARQAFETWTEARRASVGHLAAGIAHAIGNMASSISGVLQTLERKVADEYVLGKTRVMAKHVARITEVLQKMVDLGRIPSREWRSRSVGDVMARALDYALLDKRIRRVQLVVDLDPQPQPVLCLEDYLLEALLSLLLYCLEAADQNPPGRRPELRIETFRGGSEEVPMFGLRLTETGLAEEAREAACRPDAGGVIPEHPSLAASGQIVAQHGGELGFESIGEDGFRFVVAMPARQEGRAPC